MIFVTTAKLAMKFSPVKKATLPGKRGEKPRKDNLDKFKPASP